MHQHSRLVHLTRIKNKHLPHFKLNHYSTSIQTVLAILHYWQFTYIAAIFQFNGIFRLNFVQIRFMARQNINWWSWADSGSNAIRLHLQFTTKQSAHYTNIFSEAIHIPCTTTTEHILCTILIAINNLGVHQNTECKKRRKGCLAKHQILQGKAETDLRKDGKLYTVYQLHPQYSTECNSKHYKDR